MANRSGDAQLGILPSESPLAAELEASGHVNERGKRYAATAISRMLASSAPAPEPDALSLALASNPRFVVHKSSGQGFVIGGHSPSKRLE